jgi:hypothetical protein
MAEYGRVYTSANFGNVLNGRVSMANHTQMPDFVVAVERTAQTSRSRWRVKQNRTARKPDGSLV